MPIVTVEVVVDPERTLKLNLAQSLADAIGHEQDVPQLRLLRRELR